MARAEQQHTLATLTENTDTVGDCRIWRGSKDKDGYGRLTILGRRYRTHRLAYSLVHGVIAKGLCVLHSCDRRDCLAPEHLSVGTHAANVADKVAKDRQSKGEANGGAKLSDSLVALIRSLFVARDKQYGGAALGRRFGVTGQQVGRIVRGVQRAAG